MTDDFRKTFVVLCGIIAGILTLLFPVCDNTTKMTDQPDFLAVHSYLFTWPSQSVDYGRTLLQLGLVALLTFGALFSLKLLNSFQPAREQAETVPAETVPVLDAP